MEMLADLISLKNIGSVTDEGQTTLYQPKILNSINVSGLLLHEIKLNI